MSSVHSHASPDQTPDPQRDTAPANDSHAPDLDDPLRPAWPVGRSHPHHHDAQSLQKLVNRLSRIEGHVRGIRAMIEQEQPCPDVLLQIAAVRGALDRVARLILDEHISHCIAHAAETGDPQAIKVELDELKRALDRFLD